MNRIILYRIRKYILSFPKRLLNTCRLVNYRRGSYIFVNMSVKWKGLSIEKYNLGDDLNVYLIEELTKKKVLKYDEFLHLSKRNVLCIGSIIEYLCDENSIIWGSGALYGSKDIVCRPKEVLALRGPMTKEYLQTFDVKCPNIFGDPALLLPKVYNPSIKKKYSIGFIPHYKDINTDHLVRLVSTNENYKIINLQNYTSWKETINEILSSEIIVSSSLHGLIISDAYGIPNVRVQFSENIAGGDFKYKDYFMSVGRKYYKAIDCKTDIDISEIFHMIKNYERIDYSSEQLLDSCPFAIDQNILK